MYQLWRSGKGWLMATTAFLACPCHLPVTLPLLVGLLGGTVVGAWISNNPGWVYGLSTAYFLGGGYLAIRWLMHDKDTRINRTGEKAEVILIASQDCSSCEEADQLWRELGANKEFVYRRVDIASGKGSSLAAEHNIASTPTTLIDGQVVFRGVPNRLRAVRSIG